jgi:hypothetical protein
MRGFGSVVRAIGVLAVAGATVSPLLVPSTVDASPGTAAPAAASAVGALDEPSWTHAVGWGRNLVGEVGNGDTLGRFVSPVSVAGVTLGFRQVSGGSLHSLAVAADGTVYAWGCNEFGQLGSEPGGECPVLSASRWRRPDQGGG